MDELPKIEAHITEIGSRLNAATTASDWRSVVEVIERHWSVFVVWNPKPLDRALREIPSPAFVSHPILVAVREIRLRVSGDVGEVDLEDIASSLPGDSSELERLFRTRPARSVLSIMIASMIAHRLHGRWSSALHMARLAEDAARLALRNEPTDTHARISSAYSQIGITRLQGADAQGAYLALREAYDTRQHSDDPLVYHETTGNLALLLATEGEIDRSRQWLSRYRQFPLLADPLDGIAMTAELSSSLIALEEENVDGSSYRELLDALRANALGWADALTYVQTMSALHTGDPYLGLQMLDTDSRRTRHHLNSPFFQSRINALHGDAFMLLGNGTAAYEVLSGADHSPPTTAVRARVHLIAGENHDALAAARSALNASTTDTRTRLDAMLTGAVASRRLGHRRKAHALLGTALRTSKRSGLVSIAAFHPRNDLHALLHEVPPSDQREVFQRHLESSSILPIDRLDIVRITNAERRVLEGLGDGLSRRQIAARLFLSTNTVKTQIRSLYGKLRVDSAEEAVCEGHRLRFLRPADGTSARP